MSNVLKKSKQEQVVALGRLGWSLRRIERETGIRRETISGYLIMKAADIPVRQPRAWGHGKPQRNTANGALTNAGPNPTNVLFTDPDAHRKPVKDLIIDLDADRNPAKDLITDLVGPNRLASSSADVARHRSACEAYRELIDARIKSGCPAMSIFQELVDEHGFAQRYASVNRFVKKLRGPLTKHHPIIETEPGVEAQVDYADGPLVRVPGS